VAMVIWTSKTIQEKAKASKQAPAGGTK